MAVSLGKPSDKHIGRSAFPWLNTRQWKNTVKLYTGLTTLYGSRTGDSLYDGLANNDLRTVATYLRLRDFR